MNINQDKDQGKQIVELVHQIVTRGSLSVYAELWSNAGFMITKNCAQHGYINSSIQFIQKTLPSQISEFRVVKNHSEEAIARRIIDLVMPLILSGQYLDYFDIWLNAGFYITPFPAPQTKEYVFTPNLFLLGAAKSGTTSLHNYLSRIPSVCMSDPKEPFFFEAEFALGLEHYRRRYFNHWRGEEIVGEARHRNLYLPFIAHRIWTVNPHAKLVVCVRNPIERAYSHWWHWYSRKVEALEFEQAMNEDIERIQAGWITETPREREVYKEVLDSTGKGIYRSYVDSGYYYQQIWRYMEYFPKDQIKIILFDDLQEKPYLVMKELEKFIGTDYFRQDNFLPTNENPYLPESDNVKRTPISPEFRSFLRGHYQEHNMNLAHLINRDLSHWE